MLVSGELQFSAGCLNVPSQCHLGNTTCWDVHDARGKYCQSVISLQDGGADFQEEEVCS